MQSASVRRAVAGNVLQHMWVLRCEQHAWIHWPRLFSSGIHGVARQLMPVKMVGVKQTTEVC
jgi:hypothetical protein